MLEKWLKLKLSAINDMILKLMINHYFKVKKACTECESLIKIL